MYIYLLIALFFLSFFYMCRVIVSISWLLKTGHLTKATCLGGAKGEREGGGKVGLGTMGKRVGEARRGRGEEDGCGVGCLAVCLAAPHFTPSRLVCQLLRQLTSHLISQSFSQSPSQSNG